MRNKRYSGGKSVQRTVYLSLGTFKKIALGLIAIAIIASITVSTVQATIMVGNITDGKPRIALIQEEDFSFSLYQTINGITIQIAGFDNLVEAVDYFNNEVLELEEVESEPIEVIKESDDSDNGGNDDGGNGDDDNGNGDDEEPEPPIEPIEPILPDPGEEGGAEIRLDLDDNKEIITKGCFGGGYYKDDPNPRCYPTEDEELQIEPPKDTAFCAALGCLFNPPDL